MICSLDDLMPGQIAYISHVIGPPDSAHQIAEFGIYPGSTVEMIQPSKCCIIRVNGNKVCFRSNLNVKVVL